MSNSNHPLVPVFSRLQEANRFWHQALAEYSDVEGFRTNINACIQALRNITFVLQNQKDSIPNFDKWYDKWRNYMKSDPVLKWLIEARNRIVKQGDLKTDSIARAAILATYLEPPKKEFLTDPLIPTSLIAEKVDLTGIPKDVIENGMLRVERCWIDKNLKEHELLDALAHCYEIMVFILMDLLTEEEMKQFLFSMPPCTTTKDQRTIYIKMKSGEKIKIQTTAGPRLNWELAEKKYKDIMPLIKQKTQTIKDEARKFFQVARKMLVQDGFHCLLIMLFLPGGKKSLLTTSFKDKADKYAVWSHLATEIERQGATAVLVITESWLLKPDPSQSYQTEETTKEKMEVLTLDLCAEDGEELSMFSIFKRQNGKIILGDIKESNESQAMYLEPTKRMWKKNKL